MDDSAPISWPMFVFLLVGAGTISAVLAPAPAAVTGATQEPPPDAIVRERRLIDAQLEAVREATGVRVRYIDHEEEILADRDMIPAEAPNLPTVLDMVAAELERYPEPLRRELIREVHLYDTLWDGDAEWGGTALCEASTIRLSVSNRTRDEPGRFSLHHEMGHLIWCHAKTDRAAWTALSHHRTDLTPQEVGRAETWGEINPALLEAGFVRLYSSTNANEDFADMNAMIFTRSDKLDSLARHFDRIATKRDFAVDHLYRLSPAFELWEE